MKFAHPTSAEPARMFAWAKRLIDDLNGARDPISDYPTYADDAAAEAGGLPIGSGYVDASGAVRRRLT